MKRETSPKAAGPERANALMAEDSRSMRGLQGALTRGWYGFLLPKPLFSGLPAISIWSLQTRTYMVGPRELRVGWSRVEMKAFCAAETR